VAANRQVDKKAESLSFVSLFTIKNISAKHPNEEKRDISLGARSPMPTIFDKRADR